MFKYEIEPKTFGSTWVYVLEKNQKHETMVIEISHTHCRNATKDKNSLPYIWYKKGLTNKIFETYLSCHTYVTDSEGRCSNKYNPLIKLSNDKKKNIINFDWVLEDTEENEKKIIDECIRLFSSVR